MNIPFEQKNKVGTRLSNNVKSVFVLLLISIILAGCSDDDSSSSALQDDIPNQAYVKILENNLSDLPNDAQVAIALIYDGKTEYIGVTNQQNVLRGTDNADKVFEIGSITKVFTGICLSELVASNEATLSETLQEQFDYTLSQGGDITLQQLANHSSGLPRLPTNVDEVQGFDLRDPYAVYSSENLQSYLQNHISLSAPSGTQYEYSNLGMGILGYTLAQKRNSTFEEMLQSVVFEPLDMNSTTTNLEAVEISQLVEPMDLNGNIVSHWNFAETMSGAGSIKSTVTDMAKFIQKNFEDDVVYNLPQIETINSNDNLKVGLGWNIFEGDGYAIHLHDGGTGGFSSILMLDKGKKIGVVVLSNVADYARAIDPICNDLILEITD